MEKLHEIKFNYDRKSRTAETSACIEMGVEKINLIWWIVAATPKNDKLNSVDDVSFWMCNLRCCYILFSLI